MKYLLLFVIFIFVTSCAQENYITAKPWPRISYTGFADNIDSLAGEGAIDCGFHDLKSKESKRSYKSGVKCVKKASKRGLPFKFGTVRVPIDSIAREVLVLSQKSEYWLIVTDQVLGDESPRQWAQKCKEIKFKNYILFYQGVECIEVKNSELF